MWSLVGSEQLLSHKLMTTASTESEQTSLSWSHGSREPPSLSLCSTVKQLLVTVAEKVLTAKEQQSMKPSIQRFVCIFAV